eukprot:GHRR01001961.1.p1 GENE.GHRR01001961.1~~GHRR01001961.1.p1  ORF type:complete len:2104 (+),score=689.06 GHRR01001961.1:216-6527(+)
MHRLTQPTAGACMLVIKLSGCVLLFMSARYRRLTLWLPHGLASNTQLSSIKPLISICAFTTPFVKDGFCLEQSFILSRPTKGTLIMEVPALFPKQRYRVSVKADADVKDAFGLPLQPSSNAWWTMEYDPAFDGPSVSQVALLEGSDSPALSWPWVSRGRAEEGVTKAQAWHVAVPTQGSSNSGMTRALAAMAYSYAGIGSDAFEAADDTIIRNSSSAPLFHSLKLSGKPGVSFIGACCRSVQWPTPRQVFASNLLVVQSNLQAAFVEQGGRVIAWVTTSLGESQPVSGATVQIYKSSYGQDFAAQGPSCKTSTDGTCTLDLTANGTASDGSTKSALVTAAGQGPLVIPTLPVSSESGDGSDYLGAIVLDRQIVKPGDSLHITAYIQRRRGSQLEVAKDLSSVILQISPALGALDLSGTTRINVNVNATFGSAHHIIPIPSNATAASYNLQLYTPSKLSIPDANSGNGAIPLGLAVIPSLVIGDTADGVVQPKPPNQVPETPGSYVTNVEFTVADPRPPTAALTLSAPNWVKPNGTVQITVQAKSYIGSDLSGTNITIDWNAAKTSGTLELETNGTGAATARVELGKLPAINVSDVGDQLTVKATWIGPTREPIFQTKTVRIADGPIRVELARTLITDLPGMMFGVRADTFSNDDNSPIAGVSVDVSLEAANGTARLTNCSTVQLATLSKQQCSIKSADPTAAVNCQLLLPCMGDFVLKGCTGSDRSRSCSAPIQLGHNETWWQAAPWSWAPETVLMADKSNVTAGGEVVFTVQNPWWGQTSGLLVWGNAVKRVSKMLPQVPHGVSTVTISSIGDECRGSCRVALILAVSRPSPGSTAATAAAAQTDAFTTITKNVWPLNIEVRIPKSNCGSCGAATNAASFAAMGLQESGLPDVPISKLFDPLVPRTVTAELTLQGQEPESLSVNVTVKGQTQTPDGLAVLVPKSDKGSITVDVRDAGGKPMPGAEVTLLVVDKAFLDLMPYALQNVSKTIAPDFTAYFNIQDLNQFRVTQSAINATFTTLQRRLLKLDPWLPADTQVIPSTSGYYQGFRDTPPQAAAVDVRDSLYLAGYTTAITPLPYKSCAEWGRPCPLLNGRLVDSTASEAIFSNISEGPLAAASFAAPMAPPAAAVPKPGSNTASKALGSNPSAEANSAGADAAAAPGAELRTQQDFKVTVLFTVLKAAADGAATIAFTAPDNLGQFVVRAYAAVPTPAVPEGILYGAAERVLVVRRTLSLTPSLPRQVRVGDNFTAGVLVESPGITKGVNVTLTATLLTPSNNSSKALALNGPDSVTVTLTPDDIQQEVRFSFRARVIGTQNITFEATSSDDMAADRVQLSVPVLGKQGAVWVATSFAVRGSNDSNRASRIEGLELPRAENGSGQLSLVAGVGYLPAIQGTYDALVRQGLNTYQDCPAGDNAVALSVIPSMLALYRPGATPAASYLSQKQLDTTAKALQVAAVTLTDATYGLLAVEPKCLYPWSKGPARADIFLNAWATWLVSQMKPAGAGSSSNSSSGNKTAGSASNYDATFATRWSALAAATKSWRQATGSQIAADAVAARAAQPPQEYNGLETLSWARLVLGADWVPQDVSPEVQRDLSMQRLVLSAVNLTVGGQARVGLTLLDKQQQQQGGSSSGSTSKQVNTIVQRLLSNVRVGGRTAYVATGDGQRAAAGLSDQSLALVLFMRSGTDSSLIQKVAAWVGQGAAPPPIIFAATSISAAATEAAIRSRALSYYDNVTESATPNLALKAVAVVPANSSGNGGSSTVARSPTQLLVANFSTSNSGEVVRNSTTWDKIRQGSRLVFSALGSGEVSIAASLNFTPAQLLPFPTYRGLWVQRIIQPAEGGTGSLQGVGLGKMVTIAVQLTSPDDQSDVVVEVMMPGGLEPLDPNVFNNGDVTTICSSSDDESNLESESPVAGKRRLFAQRRRLQQSANTGPAGKTSFGSMPGTIIQPGMVMLLSSAAESVNQGLSAYRPLTWWTPWPVCPVQTTTPATVTFTFNYFRAGTQTIRFKAVAATSGVFILPPVKAYVQQQPEVMGLSPAGTFTVCPSAANCPAAQQLLDADAAAKACPRDCSGNGACNLNKGECICDSGFSGADCTVFNSTK